MSNEEEAAGRLPKEEDNTSMATKPVARNLVRYGFKVCRYRIPINLIPECSNVIDPSTKYPR